MAKQQREPAWVCVAAVATAHGTRGALKLRCFTERPEDAVAYGPVYDEQGNSLFELTIVGSTRGGVLVKAEGITDRNAAEALRGTKLFVPRAALPPAESDEYYRTDLEGLVALRPDGSRLGLVQRLENFGAGDVMEIATDDGTTLMVPFERQTVPVVDLEQGHVVVDPPAEFVPGSTP